MLNWLIDLLSREKVAVHGIRGPAQEVTRVVNDALDAIKIAFDDDRSVADAGVLLAATLARRLGIEALVNEGVTWGAARGTSGRAQGALVGARDAARCRQHRRVRRAA